MYLCILFTLMGLISSDITLEAGGGLVLPGSPESDTPALNLDIRMKMGIHQHWRVFLGSSFWGVKNFHQTEPMPDYLEFSTPWGYEIFGEYEDTHKGIQVGVERALGPVSLGISGGGYSRNVMTWIPGTGKRYGEENYSETGFISSLFLSVPTGRHGVLRAGATTEGFQDWFFTVTAGISVNLTPGERGRP